MISYLHIFSVDVNIPAHCVLATWTPWTDISADIADKGRKNCYLKIYHVSAEMQIYVNLANIQSADI